MLNPRRTYAAMILAALVLAAQAPLATARITERRSAEMPATVRTASLNGTTLEDLPCPEPVCPPPCCPKPCITFHHIGPKLCRGCEPPIQTVLTVKNPCTGCEVEVPICMPACCKGEPTVCSTTGIFCRDVAIYEWCCGFRVRVTFKHCGDLLVTTWGR